MIVFTVSETEHRRRIVPLASARWNDRTYWAIGLGTCGDVARQLVAHGAPDAPWLAQDVAGETLFRGKSLHALAAAAPNKAA